MDTQKGEQLIHELFADPIKFSKKGKPYKLLKEYFKGFPLETLRPLLANKNQYIQSAAVFIVCELGKNGCRLLYDIIPLLRSANRYIKYATLESVMICSIAENVREFVHVVHSMEVEDKIIRVLAMRLLSNAEELQLREGIRQIENDSGSGKFHKIGLSMLLVEDTLNSNKISEMIHHNEPLIRKYGIVAAKRLYNKFPDLITTGAKSVDLDVRKFSQDFLRINFKIEENTK